MKSISFRNSKKFFLSLTLLWIAPAFVQAGTLGQSTASGPYTAIVHDETNSSGIGLVEAYWLGP